MATAQAQARWRMKVKAREEAEARGLLVLDAPLVAREADGRLSTWSPDDGWVSIQE